jgi:hypothetical protein
MSTTISKLLNDNDFIDFLKSDINFFVDIGASCHSDHSESEVLLNHNFEGIMFECDMSKFQNQLDKVSNYPIVVLSNKVTPYNILDLLEENNVKNEFYLTLDIDGYDFFVLDAILSKYKPSFIVSEINEKIPPDIKFTVNYDPEYFWDGSHYYGYSISMLEELLLKYDYKIKFLDYNNVVLVQGKQEEPIIDVYNNGYYNKSDRDHKFYYNRDFHIINKLDRKIDKINFIKNFFDNGTRRSFIVS